eukprot:s939_g4.t1
MRKSEEKRCRLAISETSATALCGTTGISTIDAHWLIGNKLKKCHHLQHEEQVAFEDFRSLFQQLEPSLTLPDLQALWRCFDKERLLILLYSTDGDGGVTRQEFLKAMAPSAKLVVQKVTNVCDQVAQLLQQQGKSVEQLFDALAENQVLRWEAFCAFFQGVSSSLSEPDLHGLWHSFDKVCRQLALRLKGSTGDAGTDYKLLHFVKQRAMFAAFSSRPPISMEFQGLLLLVIALALLAAHAAFKLWQRRSHSSREAVQLQREAWLSHVESSVSTSDHPTAAPKLLRRRKPAAEWGGAPDEGTKAKSQPPSPARADEGGFSSSEVVALSEDLHRIPGSSAALESSEPPLAVPQPVEQLVPASQPCSSEESQVEEPDLEVEQEAELHQAATLQMFDISTDSEDESEAVKPQMFDISADSDDESEAATLQMFDISTDSEDESEAVKPQMFDISADSDDESEVQKLIVEDAESMLHWFLEYAEALSGKVSIKLSGTFLFTHACHLGLYAAGPATQRVDWDYKLLHFVKQRAMFAAFSSRPPISMEFQGLLLLVIALVLLAAHAAFKLWQRRSHSSREAVQLQREAWLSHDLHRIPGSSTALESSEPPLAVPQPVEQLEAELHQAAALQMFDISADSEDESEAATPQMFDISTDSEDESQADASVLPEPPIESAAPRQPQESEELQEPARRSISETLRAASAEEEPTESTFDELLDHLEASLMEVELSQHHAVLLKRAELHLLTLLGGLRDLLMRSLRSQTRRRTMELVGCARASRLRAVLESLHLSPGRADDRLVSCRAGCDAVDGVLADFGLQETLRQEQQEKRLALQRALEEKRRKEAELRKSREMQQAELRRVHLEQRQALTQALQTPALEDAESSLPVQKFTAPCVAPDFARGDRCLLNWFLEFAEALLGEVLCFLDGISLAILEMCSTWWRRLVGTKLSGIWRFAHLCSLGARPPMALSRVPKGLATVKGGGPWKQLWLARRKLLEEPDEAQRQVAFEQARLLLSPGSHAVVQPLKPSGRFLQMIIQNCLPDGFQHDPRFGPLQERWCSHLMVGVEAMVTHANGVQTNHEQLYMSWSVCFSAFQGLPRLFLASARWGPAQGAWEVDLAECRLPAKAPLPWAAAAQEIHELRAESLALSHGLCDATELCGFQFQGPQWRVQNPSLAPQEHWHRLYKDLFGMEQRDRAGRGRAYDCLKLLLALTCPNPFAQEPQKLALALESLQPHLED